MAVDISCVFAFLLQPSLEYLRSAAWVGSSAEERAWWALCHKELSSNWNRCGGRSCRIAEILKWQGGADTCPGLSYILHCLPLWLCLERSTSPPTHVHHLLTFLIESSKRTCSCKLSPTSPTWQITYLLCISWTPTNCFVFNFVLAVGYLVFHFKRV